MAIDLTDIDGTVMVEAKRATGSIMAYNTVHDQNGNVIYLAGTVIALPVALFSPFDLGDEGQNQYSQTLEISGVMAQLKAAVPLIALNVSIPNRNTVLFTYTDAASGDLDTIAVYYPGSSKATNYLNMVSCLKQSHNYWKARYINYAVSDTTITTQLTEGLIQFVDITGTTNEISEIAKNACIMPEDNPGNGRMGVPCNDKLMTGGVAILDSIQPNSAANIAAGIPLLVDYYIHKKNHKEE